MTAQDILFSGSFSVNLLRFKAHVPSSQIGYVNALVESYEGVCIMRTRDPRLGTLEFWVPPQLKYVFDRFIEGLRREMPVAFDESDPDDWSGFVGQGCMKR